MRFKGSTTAIVLTSSLIVHPAWAQGSPAFEKHLEKTFSAAVILMDSDVVTFGIHDFDPNEWFNLENEQIGSDESLSLRKQITVSTLPITFELSEEGATHKHFLVTRLAAFVSEQNVEVLGTEFSDQQKDTVLSGYVAYRYQYQITENWSLTPSLGTHLMYYKNDFDYKSDFFNSIKPAIDGVLVNTNAWANIYEPSIKLKYHKDKDWGSWNVNSTWHYFYGYGWGEANHGDVGNPEGWYIANEVTAKYNFDRWGRAVQSVYSSLRRIDLGADTADLFGTHYYYEAAVGWLMTPPFESEWIENIGIGLNFNYGSALKGGSIVLFFNQD